MEIIVKNSFQKGSAKKIRPILSLIKNKNAHKAMESLKHMNKNGSDEIYKMIKNGLSRAEDADFDADKMFIKKAQCDKAKELKRHRFESKGRVSRIKKHQHHLLLVMDDKMDNKSKSINKSDKLIKKNHESKKDK